MKQNEQKHARPRERLLGEWFKLKLNNKINMKLKNLFKKGGVSKASTIQKISKDQLAKVIGGTDGNGASLLGGALPGGAVVSSAVSSVSSIGKGSGSGAASASYAATG